MAKAGITNGLGQGAVDGPGGGQALFRSQPANRSNAFRSALDELQSHKTNNSELGKNCLTGPPKSANSANEQAGEVARLKASVLDVLGKGGLDNIAASALLKVASIANQSESLKSYSLQAIGSRSGGGGSAFPSGGAGSSHASGSPVSGDLGSVAARFESGDAGIDAIGYDENGGTSYGTYQISSRQGTMARFVEYLGGKAPDLAAALKSAGPANTGGRSGSMPETWKRIAVKDPERFARLQHDFIQESHYLPALQEVEQRTNVDVGERSQALQEALWSTAVQHGAGRAAKIFSKAIDDAQSSGRQLSDAEIIQRVYASRAGDFGSSNGRVQSAVRARFNEEKSILLAMLRDGRDGRAIS